MNEYLKEQFKRIGSDIKRRVDKVYSHGQFIMGPEVHELEERLADYAGTKHCITCASGTDALWLALSSVKHKPYSIPAFTFSATAEVMVQVSNLCMLADIDRSTWTSNCKLPVEIFGCPVPPADIADCAQSFGATAYGRLSASRHKISCVSFFPSKPLGCYGDGGAVFTSDDEIAATIKSLREHGKGKDKYHADRIGTNSRLDTIQAAILLAKLEVFDDELERRRKKATNYTELLYQSNVVPQRIPPNYESAWAQYCVLAKDSAHRESIREQLKQAGYETPVYYPTPIHLQPAYSAGFCKGDFPIAEDICERIFSLPFHPYISNEDIEKVCEIIWKN